MTEHIIKIIEKIIVPVLIISIVLFGYYLFIEKDKQIGLFEYVRIANKYMEKGQYIKAIGLLDKAYKFSPDNKELTKEIIYAYISYVRELDKRGELDEAIVVMQKAYRMNPSNSSVIQNLAVVYIEKAIMLANNENTELANTYLKKSVELVMVSSPLRRNISNFLYNKAVEQYNKNNITTALACLKASFSLWERVEALKLLGQIYYSKGDMEMASFYWTKIIESGFGDQELKLQLKTVNRDLEIKYKLKTIKTEAFNIKMYKEYKINNEEFAKMFSDIYQKTGEDLGLYPEENVSIIIYDSRDFQYVYNKPGIVQGFYDGSIKIPLNFSPDQKMFKAIIAHEYTHALVSIMSEQKCPVWLNEGIACYEQSKFEFFPVDILHEYIKTDKTISLSMLEKGFKDMDNELALGLSYQGSYAVVSFIVSKWGLSGLKGLLYKIRDGRHFLNAIDEQFLVSPSVFEQMANEYMKKMDDRK
ncbi:MAG: peptidase MA family metallohydrolase [Candidatus Omnitrophica bacterium]|nr:peptidase MA family metallohydrolase [Candidatus Omnitrophota bacterium]